MTSQNNVAASNLLEPVGAALLRGAAFIRGLSRARRWVASILAGAGAGLSFAPFYALPLLFLGFSTLVLLLDAAAEGPKFRRRAFLTGWLFGFGYFLVGVYWMAFSFFVQAEQFAWMAPFVIFGMPAFLGLFPALAALLAAQFWQAGWRRIFIFAAAWALLEYMRGHILTGLPWNLVSQSLAGAAVTAQLAAWIGAYGLSLLLVTLAAMPASSLTQSNRVKALFGSGAALIGLAAILAFGAIRLALPDPAPVEGRYVRIVQPNIAQRDKIDSSKWVANFTTQLELSRGAAANAEKLYVIWPENGAPLLNEVSFALDALHRQLPGNAALIAGAVRRELGPEAGRERFFNSVMVLPPAPAGRAVSAAYDKHHLVPFGEYLPFYDLLNAVGLAQLAPYGDSGFTAGPGPQTLAVGDMKVAPLVCYEAIFAGALYPRGDRPDWLVTVTNDAWFGDSSGPRQHLDQARLRAIETGLPMARSANTGVSAVIDAKGRIPHRLKLYERGVIDAPLPGKLPPTLYAQLGDGLAYMMLAAWIGIAMLRRKNPR